MELREAMASNLAFRTGMLVGTINLARDTGMTVLEIAQITHLMPTEVIRLSESATHDYVEHDRG